MNTYLINLVDLVILVHHLTVDVKLWQFTDSVDHEQLQPVGVTADLIVGGQGHDVPPHPARVKKTLSRYQCYVTSL